MQRRVPQDEDKRLKCALDPSSALHLSGVDGSMVMPYLAAMRQLSDFRIPPTLAASRPRSGEYYPMVVNPFGGRSCPYRVELSRSGRGREGLESARLGYSQAPQRRSGFHPEQTSGAIIGAFSVTEYLQSNRRRPEEPHP